MNCIDIQGYFVRSVLLFVLQFHLLGCEPESLLESLLGPGQSEIHLVQTITSLDGEVTETEFEFISDSSELVLRHQWPPVGEDTWVVITPIGDTPTYYVMIFFKSPGPDPDVLAVGDGQGYAVSIDVPEREHGGSSPFDGVMHITEHVGETWSGNATIGVDVEVMSWVQQEPTGEIIRIESIRFHRIPIR